MNLSTDKIKLKEKKMTVLMAFKKMKTSAITKLIEQTFYYTGSYLV
jgi:hypothetical protein